MTMPTPRPLAVAALLAASAAAAQTTVVDEGSFRLSIRGSTIGTETFTIRRSGSDANAATIAQGRIILDSGEQTRSMLQLRGPELRPSAYQIDVTGPDRRHITGRAAGNRFRATIVSADGEQMREYLVSDGAVIIDDGVAHQHYFIAASLDNGGRVPVILPTQSRQVTARVQSHGSEAIQVADRQVSARRITIEIDGMDTRTLWVDHRNRVLRLHIPRQDLTAERTSLP